ncbi:MAG: glycoside hydrolase family 18 protein [Planctomycetota bacterium]
MMFWLTLFLTPFLADSAVADAGPPPATPPIVAAYAPHGRGDWAVDESLPLTDILYFSVEPTAQGGVETRRLSEQVGEEITRLHEAYADRGGVRVLLCVGGWGHSRHFAAVTADDALRASFIVELAALCEVYGFDGIDYDWEHPQNAAQLADYTRLIVETAAALRPDGRIVTVAQAGWQDLGQDAYNALDRVHLMSYDHNFPQATLETSIAEIERLIGWGCPPEKIALGLPFYGRNAERDALPYRVLVERHTPDPAADVVAGYACNGPETARAKARYAREQGLAGVMAWQVYQDAEGEHSLLAAIAQELAE